LDYQIYLLCLCYAGLLSLLGLALVLRHRVSGIPDFSIIVYMWLGVFSSGVAFNLGLNIYTGPLLAFAAGCLLGWAQYRGIEGIMERRGDDTVLRTLSTIAVQIIGGAILWISAYWLDYYQSKLSTHIFHSMILFDFELLGIRGIFYIIPLVCLGVYFSLLVLRNKTVFRMTLVASGENPELAMIQGVDPWKVRLVVWTLSGGLACVAGSLFPPFLHIDPGGNTFIMIPLLAIGVLSGFESLTLAVVAAFIVGVIEIGSILWAQINVGSWMGEFRPVIPAVIVYFAMLLIPHGLTDLRKPFFDAVNYLREDKRRTLKILSAVAVIGFLSVFLWNAHLGVVEDEKADWINVSSKIGKAGALLYSDAPNIELPESLYFENVYPPTTMITVQNLEAFTNIIKREGVTIVYKHGSVLYMIKDPSLGYVYEPESDNFGR